MAVADAEARCLDEPAPVLHFVEVGSYCYRFRFTVWTVTAHIWELNNDLAGQVQEALAEAEIPLALPVALREAPVPSHKHLAALGAKPPRRD